jgi:long-subunit fatty acid transport protein
MGLVMKNLIGQYYQTSLGNTVDYAPQFRLGAVYQYSRGQVAADLDLAANPAVGSGDESQVLGVGTSYRLNQYFNFQLGYQMNLKATGNHDKGIISAGLGLDSKWSVFQFSYADNNVERALGLQFAFKF